MKKITAFIFITFAIFSAHSFDWPQEEVIQSDQFYSYFGQLRGDTISNSLIFSEPSEIKSADKGTLEIFIKEFNVNIDEIIKCTDKIIDEEFIQHIQETAINKVMLAIKREDIVRCTKGILNIVVNNEQFAITLEKIANEFYEEVVRKASLNDFIDKEYSIECMKAYIETAFSNKSFNDTNREIINVIYEEIINDGVNFINENTKDDVICRVIEAVLNVIFNNTSELLKAVNLKQITMEQIAIMEPKEIHIMFDSFAGDFFKKLYLYGSFGAIFGINLWLSIAWGIIEEINNKRTA